MSDAMRAFRDIFDKMQAKTDLARRADRPLSHEQEAALFVPDIVDMMQLPCSHEKPYCEWIMTLVDASGLIKEISAEVERRRDELGERMLHAYNGRPN